MCLNATKHYLSSEHLKILYYSLIHLYILYGNILWGNTYKTHIHKLEILQKKAIRIITKSAYNEHTSSLFKMLNILKFGDLHDLQICSFMYDFVNSNLPIPLLYTFEYHNESHGHNTRHSCDPKLPVIHTELMKKSLLYEGPFQWMHLDECLKQSASKSALKRSWQHKMIKMY